MWFLSPFSKTTGTVELVPRHSWPLLRHQYSLELVNGHLTGGSTAELFGNRISYDWDCISFLWSPYFCSLAPLTNSTVLVPRLLLSKYFGCNMCYTLGLREWEDRLQSQICGVCHGQRSLRHSLHGPCDYPDVPYVLDARVTSERGCLPEPPSSSPLHLSCRRHPPCLLTADAIVTGRSEPSSKPAPEPKESCRDALCAVIFSRWNQGFIWHEIIVKAAWGFTIKNITSY